MRPWGAASVLALAGALALPAPALAVDHMSLFVYPSALGAGSGWRLTANVPAPEFAGGELVGATLTRRFRNGEVEERHALRATTVIRSVSFDGRRGRWNLRNQLGTVLTVNMAIRATGPTQPLAQYRECAGAFAQVPVALTGTFVLRTGTTFFSTIRRARLRGLVVFNRTGPVACGQPSAVCTPVTWLSATTPDIAASLYASPDARGSVGLTFREPIGDEAGAPAWYHGLTVSGLGPVTGSPPTVDVRVPPSFPLAGGGTFTAGESSETTSGACRVTRVRGTFAGTFQARFAGWGPMSLTLANAEASYNQAR
jgi:hypothetical protein